MAIYEYTLKGRKLNDSASPELNRPEDVADYLLANCYDPDEMWREKAFAVYINSENKILGHFLISVGVTNSTDFDVKLGAKPALDLMASAVIISHNHPSGNPLPGKADLDSTQKVKKALALFDIKLLDHIIIGENSIFSFNDEKTYSLEKRN
jgi:DNA repair protein RadC